MTTTEKVGARVYLVNLPFAAKGEAKALGCHWDADRRQWWIGAAKRADAEALAVRLNGGPLEATPASARAAAAVGLAADTPAAVVADKLADEGRADAAAAVRSSETAEQIAAMRVYAAVTYRGRRYYVVAEQTDRQTGQPARCRLTTLDGLAPFWVDCSAVELVRRYEGRNVWDGRRYSGRTETRYQTVGSLRDFRDRQAREAARGTPACAVCGKRGPLVHDLETGAMTCRGCADMPAD